MQKNTPSNSTSDPGCDQYTFENNTTGATNKQELTACRDNFGSIYSFEKKITTEEFFDELNRLSETCGPLPNESTTLEESLSPEFTKRAECYQNGIREQFDQ